MSFALRLVAGAVLLGATAVILTQAERPPINSIQYGYRGTGEEYIYNPRTLARLVEQNKIPASLPQLPAVGPKASAVYKNVQVLGDLSVGQFTRLMASITTWVAPGQGCNACHNPANMASDEIYTKVVARRMIQMVRYINSDWTTHVAQTGVTCYTCHRGQLVPANVWFSNPGPEQAEGLAQAPNGKNHPSLVANNSSLPLDPYTPFLLQANDIRVQATVPLPGTDASSIKQADWTYALMLGFSEALGVNCEFCHNTRSFGDWSQSTPQRLTAWYGIRMVRSLNNDYLVPLHSVFPPARLGPTGDSPKINCATCHNGVYKPLFGVSMVQNFPELRGPSPTPH
jgi:photosynthetic reaction center cytochrome c subunit